MLLEGLEVWLIVVALGVQTHHTLAAASAAIFALLVVAAAGFVIRKPLSRVPENTIKFTVGCGILSFGTLWILESITGGENISDFAVLQFFGVYMIGGLAVIRLYRPVTA